MPRLFNRIAWVAALLLTSVSSARGQNTCSSILANGTFNRTEYRSNDYFRQIIYSRFLRSDYESSKTDTNGGFGIPLGEAVMGTANYSREDYESRKTQIRSTFLNEVTSQREIQIALTSGDERIVTAWRECMKNASGGPQLRMEVVSPLEVTLTMEFFSAPGTSTALRETIVPPAGARVTSGRECLRTGRRLTAGTPCIATIHLPRATTTWNLAINTSSGAATAYLPARIELRREVRPYRFTPGCGALGKSPSEAEVKRCEDRLWSYTHQRDRTPSHTVTLPDSLLTKGWGFDGTSARAELIIIDRYSPSGMSNCGAPTKSATLLTFQYGYSAHASIRGNDSPAVMICAMEPAINIVRERWVSKTTEPAAIPRFLQE